MSTFSDDNGKALSDADREDLQLIDNNTIREALSVTDSVLSLGMNELNAEVAADPDLAKQRFKQISAALNTVENASLLMAMASLRLRACFTTADSRESGGCSEDAEAIASTDRLAGDTAN